MRLDHSFYLAYKTESAQGQLNTQLLEHKECRGSRMHIQQQLEDHYCRFVDVKKEAWWRFDKEIGGGVWGLIHDDIVELIHIISMSKGQKYSNKDFSLTQYYNQLEKYETNFTNTKSSTLKRDYSLTAFSKDTSKISNYSKPYKDPPHQEKSKLGIIDKFTSKVSFDKLEKTKPDTFKKCTSPMSYYKTSSNIGDSLVASNVSHKKGPTDSRLDDKENIPFSSEDQQKFVDHCCQLYNLKGNSSIVNEIAKEINKRDEVYQVVSQHFGPSNEESYSQKLQEYFEQHELMSRIIEEFKGISKLQIDDLNELYYFLKSDR